MAKLTDLKPGATFTVPVPIPTAGQTSVKIPFTFKHRRKKEYDEWVATLRTGPAGTPKDDADMVLGCVESWGFEEPLTRAVVEELLEDHMGAGWAIFTAYSSELLKAREGN